MSETNQETRIFSLSDHRYSPSKWLMAALDTGGEVEERLVGCQSSIEGYKQLEQIGWMIDS